MLHKSYRKTALFFAWRYLFSKKKHNIINIISIISTIGIMVSTASLVIVLSVFNGLEDLVTNSFNQFNPDYVITPKQGKSFSIQDIDIEKIKDIPGVFAVEEIVSDLALITINNKQVLTHIKGVSNTYPQNLGLDTLIYDGTFSLVKNGEQFVVLGAINAGTLDINLNGFELLKFHYPKRDKKNLSNPIEAFNTLYLKPSGVFLSNTQYDDQIVFVPIQFAKDLTGFNDEITSLEVILTKSSSKFIEQKSIEKIVGSNFMVKNKYQQEELLFKTMKSEKLMVFLILSFVLIVAIFNIIGVIGMLIVEKKKDISILNTLGADRKLIHSIFIYEGILISFLGALLGMFIVFISVILISFLASTISIVGLKSNKTKFDFVR